MNKKESTTEYGLDALKGTRSLALSENEKVALRERLVAYADMHTMPQRASVPSPFSFVMFRSATIRVAGALVALFLIGSVSLTYAAQGALPGQTLYGVKVNVVEPVQGAIIASTQGTQGSAKWENSLTEQRLTEASTLAAKNQLTTTTSAYIEQQVLQDTDKSEQDADALAASGNTDAALAVRSDLEARLDAHTALLALIAPRLAAAGDASTTAQVAALIGEVSAAQAATAEATEATEIAIDNSATTTLPAEGPMQPATTTRLYAPHADRTASTTAAAFVRSENADRVAEEQSDFKKHIAALFALLPQATTTATSTATSTESITASSSDGTTINIDIGNLTNTADTTTSPESN